MKRTSFNYRSFALSKKKYHKSEKRRLHEGELTITISFYSVAKFDQIAEAYFAIKSHGITHLLCEGVF